MLFGTPPGAGEKPATPDGRKGAGFSLKKVARCDGYLAEFAHDATLVQAYSAKRAKELDAAGNCSLPRQSKAPTIGPKRPA